MGESLPPGSNAGPWVIGFIVMAIGVSFGANAGYAINPDRDFGPPDIRADRRLG
jgi:glycerol uptake facilitator protein